MVAPKKISGASDTANVREMIFLLRLLCKVFFIWIIGSPPKYHIEMPQLEV